MNAAIEHSRLWKEAKKALIGVFLMAGLAWITTGCSARSSAPSVPTPPPPPTLPSAPETSEGSREAKGTKEGEEGRKGKETGEGKEGTEGKGTSADKKGQADSGAETGGGPQTANERQAGLDGELDSAMGEFDELILKEHELLEERRKAAQAEAADAAGGAGAEMSGRASGSDGSSVEQTEPSRQTDARTGRDSGGSPDAPSGEEVQPEPRDSDSGQLGDTDNSRIPNDVGDGRDDDIVARQLREAAMKEEDPELREKLWDEYRAYKKGN